MGRAWGRMLTNISAHFWHHCFVTLALPLPKSVQFQFPPQTHQIITQYMKNLSFHSLLRWQIIILPILTTSLMIFPLKGWKNVLFEVVSERVNLLVRIITDQNWPRGQIYSLPRNANDNIALQVAATMRIVKRYKVKDATFLALFRIHLLHSEMQHTSSKTCKLICNLHLESAWVLHVLRKKKA